MYTFPNTYVFESNFIYLTLNLVSLLLQQVIITDDDIRRQEMKVQEARKKLESIMSRR